MKKLLSIFLLLYVSSPVFAEIQAPNWSEFCPSKYVNAEYKSPIKRFPLLKPMAFVGQVCTLNLIPVYSYVANQDNEIAINNYWVLRRHKFERRMNECKNITDKNELAYIYLTERQIQADNDNKLRYYRLAAEQRALENEQYWQYQNSQSQINALNNYNSFQRINNY